MTLILNQLFQFIRLLNSETGTNQIASGIALGFILAFSPLMSLQGVLAIVILFFFRVQIGAALLTAAFFKIGTFWMDPMFHQVGMRILEAPSLRGLFTTLYSMPIIPFTRFNHSVVMGAGVVSFALAPFVFLASRKLVLVYRDRVVTRLEKTAFWKALQATSFYKWYVKYEQLRG